MNNILTASNSPPPHTGGITIKSERELELMRRAGRVVAQTLGVLKESVRPGMRTKELDAIAAREIRRQGAHPAFKGYRNFPACICTSVNEEVVHGIPGDRVLREGDLLKLDVGAIAEGYYGDAAVTVGVGNISREAEELIEVTCEALERGIRAAKAGARIGDIGATIESFVASKGYSVVREYVGHGVGRALHEEPQIPNYGQPGKGPLLRQGMVIAIEPMVNVGGWKTGLRDDQWTVVTADGSLSAHFEHTIAIANSDAEILTVL